MSFIRSEDRRTRLRRLGVASGNLTENEIAQIDAINNTSSYCRTLFFSYLALGATLFILVSGTTHEDLLRETPVKMPLFDIGVPLLTFYVVAPFLFALFHFNLLNKLSQLRMQIEDMGDIERGLIRERLFPFDYTLLIGGFGKNQRENIVLWLIVGPALYFLPVALFIYAQYKFLAYHSTPITTWHSFLVFLSVLSLALFHAGSESPAQLTVAALRRNSIALTIWVSSLFFLTPPDSWIDTPLTNKLWWDVGAVGMYRNLELPDRTFRASDPPPVIIATYIEKYGPDDPRVEEALLNYGHPIDLRDRDLRYANLEGSGLPLARLTGAELQGAVLDGGQFRQAHFGFTNLQAVNLSSADLHGAVFDSALLQGAILYGSNLQQTDFGDADLRGAVLSHSDLRGSNLASAQLQGAALNGAELAEAVFPWAQFQGASFADAGLQGADLSGARLQGTGLSRANLQGVNLSGAHLQGSDLEGADLQGADLSSARLQGVSFKSASLRGADLRGAHLQGANFQAAVLQLADFSGATVKVPSSENRVLFWSKVVDSTMSVPKGVLRDAMTQRLNSAAEMESARTDSKVEFLEWLAVAPVPHQDTLHRFLIDLACEGGGIVGNGIARHRAIFPPEGAVLARTLMAHRCANGKPLKESLSKEVVETLNETIKADGDRYAREID